MFLRCNSCRAPSSFLQPLPHQPKPAQFKKIVWLNEAVVNCFDYHWGRRTLYNWTIYCVFYTYQFIVVGCRDLRVAIRQEDQLPSRVDGEEEESLFYHLTYMHKEQSEHTWPDSSWELLMFDYINNTILYIPTINVCSRVYLRMSGETWLVHRSLMINDEDDELPTKSITAFASGSDPADFPQ